MKWFGNVGFATTVEQSPGVWVESIEERPYYGELLRNIRRLRSSSEKVNDDIEITNELSIIADPFVYDNIQAIRYASFMGSNWKVESVDVQYPRINMSLGGLYHAH